VTDSSGASLGRVAAVYRFPVKSLRGELLEEIEVEVRGLAGDRLWSVRDPDGKLGSGKSTRRFRRMDGLLELTARYDRDVPVVGFPDGTLLRGDDPQVHAALSDHVGRPVTLEREAEVSHFDEGPVHLVTTASLRTLAREHGTAVDERRTRANVVLDHDAPGFPEHAWVGRRIRLGGTVVLRVLDEMPRCVMVTMAQDDLGSDPTLLRDITEHAHGALGVVCAVERPGTLRRGDLATLQHPADSAHSAH
jgi:uncharacterized protein YcbX